MHTLLILGLWVLSGIISYCISREIVIRLFYKKNKIYWTNGDAFWSLFMSIIYPFVSTLCVLLYCFGDYLFNRPYFDKPSKW